MENQIEKGPFIETLPVGVDAKLKDAKPSDEDVLIQVATDMDSAQSFGEQWLVVTDQRLLLIPSEGIDGTVEISLEEVKEVKHEDLVGGGRLELDKKKGETVYLHYSNSMVPKFAEVAEAIRQLSKGKEIELPTELERSRCPKCERLLPEKGGICPACMKKLDTLRRILGFLLPYRSKAALLLIVSVSSTLVELIPPLITQRIIDDVLTPRDHFNLLVWLVLGLLGINIIAWLARVGRTWLSAWVGFRAVEDMRAQLYRALQFLPLRFYDKRKVGALISRMTNDSDLVEVYITFDIPFVFSNGLLIFGIIGLLFYMNWELALYVLLPVPPIVLGSSLIWNRLEVYWRRWSNKWSRLSSHLNESISGIRVIKAFAQEKREGDRFDRRNSEVEQVSIVAERSWLTFFMLTNFLMSFGVFIVWYFGGRKILGQELTLGVLMAFISYLWMLYQPLRWFGDFYGFMVRAYAGAERVFEIIDSKPEPFEDADAIPMTNIDGRVTFKDVRFGYDPGKTVLKGIDLEVEAGEMIGLVGKSGVGKSTLINLVCRFYDVDGGCIEIDGVDIRKIRLEDLRCRTGMVHQEPFLFNGTISENISYAAPGATFDEIVRAAVAAEAHSFIVAKPDGYNTVVSERGGKLSGGEKQRISIARAILHDPKILILDEATSSVGAQTEKKIQDAVARLVKGRTTFAIAHRLSTLRSADRLVVLDDGKIAEVGTHKDLMEREGLFYRLVQTQLESSSVMAVGGGKDDPERV